MKALALVLVFVFVGCTSTSSVICEVSKAVSSLVASQISVQLTCKNVTAVKASIDEQLVSLKICDKAADVKARSGLVDVKSATGNVICPLVVDTLAAGLLHQIPASWECTGGELTDSIKAQILAACEKAI